MMDYSKEYQVALELASALRYEEAGQKLKLILEEHPDNMDALILLGKVEYYLGLFPSSRRRFETVLTHDPGNFEAYYGLRFFTERKRRLWTITAWLTSIFLFLSIAVFLNISIRAGFNRFEESFSEQNGYYYEALKELSDRMLGMSENLDQYAHDLDKLKESLDSGIEALNEQISDLDLKQEEQFSKLGDTQAKYYRTTSEEIKDLKETAHRLKDRSY
ncbi:MAG: hypothetical protein PF693_15535 [Spirochaetia bacterium]|jgi:tetratricopeptide (TPR) repeat protein|nr:hypothetical protein [Spirochaetia bacterium]